MRHLHRRLLQQETVIRIQDIRPPPGQLPRDRHKIEIRILTSQ